MSDWILSEQGTQLVMSRSPRRWWWVKPLLNSLYEYWPRSTLEELRLAQQHFVFDKRTNTISDAKGRVLGRVGPNDHVGLREAKIWQGYRYGHPLFGSIYREGLILTVGGTKLCESANTSEVRHLARSDRAVSGGPSWTRAACPRGARSRQSVPPCRRIGRGNGQMGRFSSHRPSLLRGKSE